MLYELKVELEDIHPQVWRMLQVPSSISLHKLHLVLQKAMGWKNYHLYMFYKEGKSYSQPNSEWGVSRQRISESV